MDHLNRRKFSDIDSQKSGIYISLINNDTNSLSLQRTKYSTIKLVKNPFKKLPKILPNNQNQNNSNKIDDLRKNLIVVNNSLKLKNNSIIKSSLKAPFLSHYKISPVFINKNKLKDKTKYPSQNKISYFSYKPNNKSAVFENFDLNKNFEKITNITIKQSPILTPSNYPDKNYNNLYNDIKLNNPKNFHKKLMLKNMDILNNSKLNEFLEIKHKEKLQELDKENYREKKLSPGVYGSPKNIISDVFVKIERMKMDDDFEKGKQELREPAKNELTNTKIKLKIKPDKFKIVKFNRINPSYFGKPEKFKYLSKRNKIALLNRNGNIPMVVKDDQIMYNLFDDAYKTFKDRKSRINDDYFL